MKASHTIFIELDFQCTKKNIQFVLHKASELGFVYIALENSTITSRCLTLDEATAQLVTTTDEIKSDDQAVLYGKFQDTGMYIRIYKADANKLGLSFGNFVYQWEHRFHYGIGCVEIDFDRYIRLILHIEDVLFLQLYAFTNKLGKIIYDNNNCVTAALNLNVSMQHSIYTSNPQRVIESFIRNGACYEFVFF